MTFFFIFIFITTVGRVSIQSNSNSKPFVLNVCDTFIYFFFFLKLAPKKEKATCLISGSTAVTGILLRKKKKKFSPCSNLFTPINKCQDIYMCILGRVQCIYKAEFAISLDVNEGC